jgi:hypothetical protein
VKLLASRLLLQNSDARAGDLLKVNLIFATALPSRISVFRHPEPKPKILD